MKKQTPMATITVEDLTITADVPAFDLNHEDRPATPAAGPDQMMGWAEIAVLMALALCVMLLGNCSMESRVESPDEVQSMAQHPNPTPTTTENVT